MLWKYTAQQVLTMEYAPGVKINRTAEIEAMGVNRKELARRTVECYLQQLLTYGFFHAGAPCSHFHCMIILSSIFWLNLIGRGSSYQRPYPVPTSVVSLSVEGG